MIYRALGQTGLKVSAIGFGGMRFRDVNNRAACCATLERAVALGITYFDTAPGYSSGKSEERLGEGLQGKAVLISTKSMQATGAALRRDLEASLKRLRRERIDVFHIWYVLTYDDYLRRKTGGAIQAALQARAEGLIGELFLSTHMEGPEVKRALAEGVFAGVTLGFSPINAPFRMAGVEQARRQGLAVVCMNPLGGGVIPRNPEYFAYLRGPADRNVVAAALRYILSIDGVSVALVGGADPRQVEEAVAAVTPCVLWTPRRMAALSQHLHPELQRLCTGCRYCAGCPVNLPIPRLMLAYNYKILGGSDRAVRSAISDEFGLTPDAAAGCTACGACEKQCTQKLPIIARLKYIAKLKGG